MTTSQSLPLACEVDAIPAEERAAHSALTHRLFQSLLEKHPLQDGYVFTFEPDSLMDVARFMQNERLCCPFLSFTLKQGPDQRRLTLRLAGPRGTRPFLESELPL